MLKVLCGVALVLAVGPASVPPEPQPPRPPITVSIEVGKVDGGSVRVRVTSSPKQGLVPIIEVIARGTFGATLEIAPVQAEEFAVAVAAAAEDADRGVALKRAGAGLTIRTTPTDQAGRYEVSIVLPQPTAERLVMSPSSMTLDSDNARLLATLVRRAHANAAWLVPRLAEIDLSRVTDPSADR